MGQTKLVGEDFGVDFSSKAFCKFLRCSECGVYVYRVDNQFDVYIGDVVSYTFLDGEAVCMGCFHVLEEMSKRVCPFDKKLCSYPLGKHFKSSDFVGCKIVDYEHNPDVIIWACPRFPLDLSITAVRDAFMRS